MNDNSRVYHNGRHDPVIVPLDRSTFNLLSQAFAWSNKWLHKGTDWMLT